MLAVGGGGGGREGEYPSEGNLTEPQLMTRYTEALRKKDDDSSATYESGTREPDVVNDDGERYRAESKSNDTVSPEIDSNEIPLAAHDSIARGGILGNNDIPEEYIDTSEEVEDKPEEYIDTSEEVEDKPYDSKLDKYVKGKPENIETRSSASNPVKVDKSKHRIIAHNKHEASDIADNNNIDDNNEGGASLTLRDTTAVRNGGVGVQKGEENKENHALAADLGSSSGSRYRNAPSVNTTIFVNIPQIVILPIKASGREIRKLLTSATKSVIDITTNWPNISINNDSSASTSQTSGSVNDQMTGYQSRDFSSSGNHEMELHHTSLYSVLPVYKKRATSRDYKPRDNTINYEIYPPVITSSAEDIDYDNASLTSIDELEHSPSYREAGVVEDNATSQHRRSDSSTGTRGSSTDDINYSNAPLTSLTSSLSSIGERDIDVTIVTDTDAYMDAAVYKYGTTSQYRRSGSSTGNTSSYTNNTDNGKAPLTIRDERNTIDATKSRDVDITNYKIIILHRKHSSSTGNRGLSERYQPNTIYAETNSKRLKVNVDVNIKGSLSLSDSEDKDDFKK